MAPDGTVPSNISVEVPDPEIYDTVMSVIPVSRVITGVPVTVTDSLINTETLMVPPIGSMVSPNMELTPITVGDVVSTEITVFAPNDPAPPTIGSVLFTVFSDASVIVPNVNAAVEA